jgi:hypothetical protein
VESNTPVFAAVCESVEEAGSPSLLPLLVVFIAISHNDQGRGGGRGDKFYDNKQVAIAAINDTFDFSRAISRADALHFLRRVDR